MVHIYLEFMRLSCSIKYFSKNIYSVVNDGSIDNPLFPLLQIHTHTRNIISFLIGARYTTIEVCMINFNLYNLVENLCAHLSTHACSCDCVDEGVVGHQAAVGRAHDVQEVVV